MEQTRFWSVLSALLMFVLHTLVSSLLLLRQSGSSAPALDRGLAGMVFVMVISLMSAVNATNNLRLVRAHWLGRAQAAEDGCARRPQ